MGNRKVMENKICMCDCHIKGTIILHYMPCCEYCYQHYINKDGTIDYVEYSKIKSKRKTEWLKEAVLGRIKYN